jgi:hypothetical protein
MGKETYFSLLGLLVALGLACEFRTLPGPDIAFFLHASGRLVDGARLYRDVVEINPPLILALNVPPVLLARLTGWSEFLWYRLLTTGLLLGSLVLTSALLRRIVREGDITFHRWVMALLCFALFLIGASDYGQREHLLLALILPYLILTAARAGGSQVRSTLASGVGVLAGIGFALKPHFVVVWPAVELARMALSHRRSLRVYPETLLIGTTLVLYLGITILLAPEYVDLVRLLAPDYRHFLSVPIQDLLLSGRRTPLLLGASLITLGLIRRARYRELWIILLVGMLAAFVAGVAQGKGWRYHFYPWMALLCVLLGVVGMDAWQRIRGGVRLVYAALALAFTATAMVWFVGSAARRALGLDTAEQRKKAQLAELAAALTGRGGGNGLFVFSFATESGFPLVNYTGLQWASRFPQLWLLVGLYWDQLTAERPLRYRERKEMGAAERFLNDAVYEDLSRHRPALLLVLRQARDVKSNGPRRLDYLSYFGRDPRIADVLRQYRPAGLISEYQLYERGPAGHAASEPVPTARAGTLDLPIRRARHDWAAIDLAMLVQLVIFAGSTLVLLVLGRRDRSTPSSMEPAVPEGP